VFADGVALIFAELPPFLPLFDRQDSPDRLEDPGPDGPQFRELLVTGQRIVVPDLDERFEFQRESVSDSGCGWRDQTRAAKPSGMASFHAGDGAPAAAFRRRSSGSGSGFASFMQRLLSEFFEGFLQAKPGPKRAHLDPCGTPACSFADLADGSILQFEPPDEQSIFGVQGFVQSSGSGDCAIRVRS